MCSKGVTDLCIYNMEANLEIRTPSQCEKKNISRNVSAAYLDLQ
jgi:hypothetical protein